MPRITAAPGEVKRVLRMAEECGIGQPLTKGDRVVPLRRIVGACGPAVMEGVMVWEMMKFLKSLLRRLAEVFAEVFHDPVEGADHDVVRKPIQCDHSPTKFSYAHVTAAQMVSL